MKYFLLLITICSCVNFSFAQDSSKHSIALNIGGFHQTPTRQSNIINRDDFHFAKHLGGTYRFKFTQKQLLRASVNFKNIKKMTGDSEFGRQANYNETLFGVGYEFIIKKGMIEPYVGFDAISIFSKNVDHIWVSEINSYRTRTRFGYGASLLVGLRYNASEKLAIGLETNMRYLWNRSRFDVVSDDPVTGIGTINYYNLSEFNPFSAIVVKYNI